MYTQCPECGTIFKVTPDVLRVARGVVRCGVCDATFNAVHFLSSQPAPAQPAGTSERRATPPTPAGLASLHAQVAAFQAAQPDTFSTGRFAARIASSLREAEHERAWIPAQESEPPATDETPATDEAPATDESPATDEPLAQATPPMADEAAVRAHGRAPSTASELRDAEIEAAPDTALEFDPVATDWNTVFISPPSRSPGSAPAAAAPLDAQRDAHADVEEHVDHTHPSIRAHTKFDSAFGDGKPTGQSLAGAFDDEHADERDDHDEDEHEDHEDADHEDEELDDDIPMPLSARPDAEAIGRLFRETAAAAADVQHKSATGAHRARHDEPPPAAADDPDAFAHEIQPLPESAYEPTGVHPDFEAVWEPVQAETYTARPRDVDPAEVIGITRPTRTVEPLTLNMPEPVEPSRGYAAAAILALLLLGLQAAHFWRESIAALPIAGAAIQRAYEAIGRPIEPRWSLAEYEVKQLGASSDVPGTLRLLARVQNKASRAQPYPLLRVTLLDRFETKIARREFTPAEYLPSRRRPEGLLPPDQRVDADLLLADPGNDAVNYELDACLYEHNRLICAQDSQSAP